MNKYNRLLNTFWSYRVSRYPKYLCFKVTDCLSEMDRVLRYIPDSYDKASDYVNKQLLKIEDFKISQTEDAIKYASENLDIKKALPRREIEIALAMMMHKDSVNKTES